MQWRKENEIHRLKDLMAHFLIEPTYELLGKPNRPPTIRVLSGTLEKANFFKLLSKVVPRIVDLFRPFQGWNRSFLSGPFSKRLLHRDIQLYKKQYSF